MENNWHIPDISEIEKLLGTSVDTGLTNKEARSRLKTLSEDSRKSRKAHYPFIHKEKSAASVLASSIFTLPTALLILLGIMMICFGRALSGAALLLLSVAGAVTVGICDLVSCRRLESAKRAFLPLTRVKRGGVRGFTDGRNIVPGDVIILESGAVLPCDARLISGSVTLEELYFDDSGIKRRIVEKRANTDTSGENTAFANMVFAGSCVVSGAAEAIAVAVHADTYIMQKSEGAIVPRDEDSKCLDGIRLDLYRLSFVLLSASVILSCVGLLTLAKHEFVSVFASLIASISYISLDVLRIFSRMALSSYIKRSSKASRKESDLSSYIRGIGAADKLSTLTDAVLLGGAAFSDGIYKIDSAVTVDGRITNSFDMRDAAVNELFFCTYAYLVSLEDSGCENLYVKEGIARSFAASVKEKGFDCEGADLAIKSMYFANSEARYGGFACAETSDGFFRVALLPSDVKPDEIFGKNLVNYSKAFSERYDSFISDRENHGAVTLTVIKEMDGKVCVAGVISLMDTPIGIVDEVSALERSGITLYAFFPEDSKRTRALLSSSGLGDLKNRGVAFASEISDLGSLTSGDNLPFAYVGYSKEEYIKIIETLKSRGGTVACFGVRSDATDVMAAADLGVSCDLINYAEDRHSEAFYEKLPPEGGEDDLRSANNTVLISGVKIKRAHTDGGGLAALRNAVFGAKRSYIGLALSARLWLRTSLVLVAFAFMSVLTGNLLLDVGSAVTLSSGFAAVSILVFSCGEYRFTSEPSGVTAKNYPDDILRADIRGIFARIIVVVGVSLFVTLLNIFEIFGEDANFVGATSISLVFTLLIESALASRSLLVSNGAARIALLRAGIAALAISAILVLLSVLDVGIVGFVRNIAGLELLSVPVYALAYSIVAVTFSKSEKSVKQS